jgi:hypothetical protein
LHALQLRHDPRLRRQLWLLPAEGLLSLRQPGTGAQQERAVDGDGASHGVGPWTQLRTRRSGWRASWPIRRCAFDLPAKELELADLTSRSSDPGLWDDPAAAQALLRRADELREEIGAWQELGARATALGVMAELAAADPDGGLELAADLQRDLASLSADWNRMESSLLLSEPYDERPAFVSVHAGAGGTESQDWAEMLLRI